MSCPSCGKPTSNLIKVEAGKKLALGLSYDEVCADCYETLPEQVSQGFKLRQEEQRKHENKVKMWKSRVELVKQGRSLLKSKAYAEAAMCYEKYLKVLELIYEVGPGGLTPETFSNSTRSKELTVLVTVYWDLVRIYDTSPRYSDRLSAAVGKLSQFASYSPIFPNIVKKAESFVGSAKNPKVIREFLKSSNARRGGCFIATAAFGSGLQPEVQTFYQFRDQILTRTQSGQLFIRTYYKFSPFVASIINRYSFIRSAVRLPLKFLALLIKRIL